jgi:hypothetical protein
LAVFFANNLPWIINEKIIIKKKLNKEIVFQDGTLEENLDFKERPQLTLIYSRTTIPNKKQTYVLRVPITNAK